MGATNSTLGDHHVSGHPGTVIARARIGALSDTSDFSDLAGESIDDGLCAVPCHLLAARARTWDGWRWIPASRWHAAFEVGGPRAFIGLGDSRGTGRCETAVSFVARAAAGFRAAFDVVRRARARI